LGNLSPYAIYLDGNALTSLPESLGRLTGIAQLRVSHNLLTEVPESLGDLDSIRELSLRGNALTSLPESLRKLTSLEKLDLSHNALRELPEWLSDLGPRTRVVRGNQRARVGGRCACNACRKWLETWAPEILKDL
jgi:Leucine-rich repeat (LRR) protein